MVGRGGERLTGLTTGGKFSILPFFIVILMLVGDVSALARPSASGDESSPSSPSMVSAAIPSAEISSTDPILVEGISPLMCGEAICATPERNLERGERFAEEPYGWWLSYGPDRDWNGMDDRLQLILSGDYESESPTAIEGADGRSTVAITVDFAWHPNGGELAALQAVLDAHGWVGEDGGAWWKPMRYLDAVAVDKVPVSALLDIWAIDGVVVVEMQNVFIPFLETATPSVLARDSETYSNEAHKRGYRGDGVVLAIIDTGVDNEHRSLNDFDDVDDEPDFSASSYSDQKWVAGYDATSTASRTDGSEDPNDGNGHGSHCAGIAVGTGDASRINMGVAPGAYLVDIKVLTDTGGTNSQYSYNGIEWMIQNVDTDWDNNDSSNGIQVASLSFGTFSSPVNNDDTGGNGSSAEARLVNRAVTEGIVMVVAMGNDGKQRVPSPANADRAISVAAANNRNTIDRDDDTVASYSNSGPRDDDDDDDEWDELKPTVTAPGSGINSVSADTTAGTPFTEAGKADTDYEEKDGTSMSTPMVAGIVAIMLSADPDLSPGPDGDPIRDIIQNYSQTKGSVSEPGISDRWNDEWGFGLANVACYLDTILSIPCDGDPNYDGGSGGGGGGGEPIGDPSDALNITSPTINSWFVVGNTHRVKGELNKSVSSSWEYVEARIIDDDEVVMDWTRAGGSENWFIDITPKSEWADSDHAIIFKVRAISAAGNFSDIESRQFYVGKHEITFTEPTGHDTIQGIEGLGGEWEGIEASAIEVRVDSGDWNVISNLGEQNYHSSDWSYSWDSTVVDDGTHRLTVRLVNKSGLVSDEIRRTFHIDNEPPAPDFAIGGGIQVLVEGLPSEGAYVQSTIEVHVNIVNNGDKDVNEVIVRLIPDGGKILEQIVSEMRQGEVHTIIFWNWMPETIGMTNVTLSVDPTDTHGDENRDNNDYTFSFDVYERPNEVDVRVRPESISTNPRIPSSGDPFEVIAKIENVGQVASANVTIYLEEFLEGAGWQEVADSQYEIKTVAGSTVSTAYEVYRSAVPAGTGVVREFRITALQDESQIENDKSNNFATFNVIFNDLELVGSGTQLSTLSTETPLGYVGVGDSGHLLTSRDGELHLRTISRSFTMPGDTTIESDYAGHSAIISSGDETSFIAWTRRIQSADGYTLHDVAFVTVDKRGKTSQVQSLTTPLKISEGSYWGLSMAFDGDLLILAGFHHDIATGGSYQDITNLILLSTTNPSSAESWVLSPVIIPHIDISSHQGSAPAVAIGEDRIHFLYEAMREDTTGISRVGMFYASGVLGHPLSIQTGVGDNASLPNLHVTVIDGDDVVMAVWREGTGRDAELVYVVTDGSWSVEEPERHTSPGMSSIDFVADGEGVQVLFDKVGFQGPEVHFGILMPDEAGFSASLEEGYFFASADVDGDTHFLYWSKAGGFFVHNLVDPASGSDDAGDLMSLLDRVLEPLPGDRDMKIKIASGILGLIVILLIVVSVIIRRGRQKEIEFIEKGGAFVETEDSDVELVEEEVAVAIDLEAEQVEVSVPKLVDEGPTLAETLKEAAQEDSAGERLRRRMERLEKAEQEELLAELPPPKIFDRMEYPGLELPSLGDIPPTISLEELPPPPLSLDALPVPLASDIERHAECKECGAHFTVKNNNLNRMSCPMCDEVMEL
jgi:hypothetical protein